MVKKTFWRFEWFGLELAPLLTLILGCYLNSLKGLTQFQVHTRYSQNESCYCCYLCCSVVKSCTTLCDPHGLQHARLPCPSLCPGVCSDLYPLSWWCHPAISSSVTPFSSCPQSFLASRSFPTSQLFVSCGQSIGASARAFPMNIQGSFPLGLTFWSPCCPRDTQESSPAPQFENINSSALSLLYGPALTWLLERP